MNKKRAGKSRYVPKVVPLDVNGKPYPRAEEIGDTAYEFVSRHAYAAYRAAVADGECMCCAAKAHTPWDA